MNPRICPMDEFYTWKNFNISFFTMTMFLNQYGYIPKEVIPFEKLHLSPWETVPKGITVYGNTTKPGKA